MPVRSVCAILALALSVSLAVRSQSASAQDGVCDSLLDNNVAGPWAYSRRGDRCEGLYVEQVSGAVLAIVSFTSVFEDYDLDSGTPLIVEWTAPGAGEVHLRARSLEPKIYYQMDSRPRVEAESFRWPLEILAGVRLGRALLGVLGSMEWPLAGRNQRVLLPLRIGQGGGSEVEESVAQESYELKVRPGVELREIYLSLATVGDNGTEQDYLIDEEALNYHYYPAERAVLVPLPPLPKAGFYYVLIAAELARGADATVEAYFYHPGG